MRACCTCGIEVQPPDAVVGQHRPRALDCGQHRVGFGNHCTQKPHPVPCAWNLRAEDNPDRLAMGPALQLVAQHQPVTKVRSSGLKAEAVVLETGNQGSVLQPKPSVLPGSLLVASSTARLLRLPVRVHRAYGAEGQCSESCSCLASVSWKPVPA